VINRYLAWALEQKHWKLWGFWIPLVVIFAASWLAFKLYP
jgi:hypothetical protein